MLYDNLKPGDRFSTGDGVLWVRSNYERNSVSLVSGEMRGFEGPDQVLLIAQRSEVNRRPRLIEVTYDS